MYELVIFSVAILATAGFFGAAHAVIKRFKRNMLALTS